MEPLVQQQLFMHTLNYYVYFYEDGCSEVRISLIGRETSDYPGECGRVVGPSARWLRAAGAER